MVTFGYRTRTGFIPSETCHQSKADMVDISKTPRQSDTIRPRPKNSSRQRLRSLPLGKNPFLNSHTDNFQTFERSASRVVPQGRICECRIQLLLGRRQNNR